MMPAYRPEPGRFNGDTRATSAIEFAIIAPVFAFILAASIDFGGLLYTKFSLDGALAAAVDYGILNAGSANASAGSGLATSLVGVVASGHPASWTNATIVVNNGPSATLANAAVSTAGTASAASACYCPTPGANGLNWGAPTSCGASCGNGSLAGRYVTIIASHTYKPFFSSSTFIGGGVITASAVVQVQ